MALVKKTPAFEGQEDNVASTMVADNEQFTSGEIYADDTAQAVAEPTPTPEVKAAATTAIAAASSAASTAVAVTGQRFQAALQGLKYVFSMEDVRSIGLAAPRLTIDTGGFTKDGEDLGKSLTVQILSHNPRWLVSAGIQGDEGKELVRFSYDGIHIDDSDETLNEYLAKLKDEGYTKASKKEYTDLWVIVVGGAEEAAGLIGETCVIQLSPQSGGQFKWFQTNLGIKIARGLAKETDTVKIGVERTKVGSDTFGRATFTAA